MAAVLMLTAAAVAHAQKKKPLPKPVATNAKAPENGKCPSENGLTAAEVSELITMHNSDRVANDIPLLKWDCSLAAAAQEWANRSVFGHREETPYGENIFVTSTPDQSIRSAMDRWLTEKAFWTNRTGTCSDGKICTHYTQIVWRKTQKFGCGIDRNATGKWKVMLVCNYDPAGNMGGPAF